MVPSGRGWFLHTERAKLWISGLATGLGSAAVSLVLRLPVTSLTTPPPPETEQALGGALLISGGGQDSPWPACSHPA